MGNSEVGHMNLGAGRIVMQDLPRIDKSFLDGSFLHQEQFQNMIRKLKKSGGACHVMGLASPGGVHSHQHHILSVCRLLNEEKIPVFIHMFLDGRDSPPMSALEYNDTFSGEIAELNNVNVATVMGRFFPMDRDKRWYRVEKAYNAIINGMGVNFNNVRSAIKDNYKCGVTDEFIEPCVISDFEGVKDGDGIFMSNFRADRVLQLLSSFADPAFGDFQRNRLIDFSCLLGMVEYSQKLNKFYNSVFAAQQLGGTLGEVVASNGMTQLRIAETEKYAHVTFFFNGGREEKFENEERILIPSPKVSTYDLCPEMSCEEMTDKLERVIKDKTYDLIIVNFANADMVGHSGSLSAAIKAAEAVDVCLDRLEKSILACPGIMLITADHGNIENMVDDFGNAHTQHTLNTVPILLINGPEGVKGINNGRLSDVAPTILDLMNISKPTVMTGSSLIQWD